MDWAAFYPYIEPLVKGCPLPVMDQAIRETATEFCNRSLVWYDTRPLAITASTAVYNLPKPADAEITQVMRVAPAGRAPLIAVREQELDDIMDWESATGDYATHYLFTKPGRIQLYPIPENAMTLQCRSAFRPSEDATGCEDFIFESWRDCIVQGALAKVKAIPKEFWSDAEEAARAAARFSAYVNKARNDKTRGYHYGSLQVALRRFA
jgi:hypothetical protein